MLDTPAETKSSKTDTYIMQGIQLSERGRDKEALAYYDLVLQLDSKSVAAYHNKGCALANLGYYEQALDCFDKALSLDRYFISSYVCKGSALCQSKRLNRYAAALVCYDEALKLDPKCWAHHPSYHSDRAMILHRLELYEEAAACYKIALEADPKNVYVCCKRGEVLNLLGRHKEALACYESASKLDPEDLDILICKGMLFEKLEDFAAAIACYEVALKLAPKRVDIYCNLGDAHSALHHYQQALDCYDRALQLDPQDVFTHKNKGITLYFLKYYYKALGCFENALKLDPKDVTVHNIKGNVLLSLGHYQKALACFEHILSLDCSQEVLDMLKQAQKLDSRYLLPAQGKEQAVALLTPSTRGKFEKKAEAVGRIFSLSGQRGDSKREIKELKSALVVSDISQEAKVSALITQILNPPAVTIEINPDFCCFITQVLFREPVVTVDGHTYEREAIEKWFETKNTAPATQLPLPSKQLAPNILIQKVIQDLIQVHPELKDTTERYLPQRWVQHLAKALKDGDEKSTRALVDQDRRLLVHPLNDIRQRAIHLAAVGHPQSLEMIMTLLEKRQPGLGLAALLEADNAGQLAIHYAIRSGQPENIVLQLMHWMGNHLKTVKLPEGWEQFMDVVAEAKGLEKAFEASVIAQNLPHIDFLLQHGVSANTLNKQGESMVYQAVKHGKIQSLLALLAAGADPNRTISTTQLKDSPLHAAIRQGDHEAVAVLKKYEASLTLALSDGSTPLHVAAEFSNPEIAAALYEDQGVPSSHLEAKDAQARTPLQRAFTKKQLPTLTWLVAQGAQTNTQNVRGHTPLHLAVDLNQLEVVTLLLERDASLNVKDIMGNTALHLAAQTGAGDILEVLLRHGFSADTQNNDGKTARQLAEVCGHKEWVTRHDRIIRELSSASSQGLLASKARFLSKAPPAQLGAGVASTQNIKEPSAGSAGELSQKR